MFTTTGPHFTNKIKIVFNNIFIEMSMFIIITVIINLNYEKPARFILNITDGCEYFTSLTVV